MDEMKLLEDFRAAVAPPDDRILAQARSRMLAADPDRSGTRARSPLRRVRWPQLAVSGAAIAAIAVAAIVAFSDWEEWLNLALGVWLMISPWLFGFMHTKAMHVSILLGAMVAFVAALELWLVHYDHGYDSEEPKQVTGSKG